MTRALDIRRSCYATIVMIPALFILVLAGQTLAQNNWRVARFALVPLANHSEFNVAREQVESLLLENLSGRCSLVPSDSLRSFMRAERLRLVGNVDAVAATKLRGGVDVDYVITGSVEAYEPGALPEFSLCLRVYNCWDSEIVWMQCAFATGEDLAGAFGIGETSSLDKVMEFVIENLMADFDLHRDGLLFKKPKESGKASKLLNGGTVALIPFDHSTLYHSAGDVVSDFALAKIWQEGFRVAEPGDVARVLIRARQLYFGAATDRGMKVLMDSLGVAAVVSGTVFSFTPLKGQLTQAGPLVGLSLRLVDPASGDVLSATDGERNGAHSMSVFGAGREYSMGESATALAGDLWGRLVSSRREPGGKRGKNSTNNDETAQR